MSNAELDESHPTIVKPAFAPDATNGEPDVIIDRVLGLMIRAGYPESAQCEFVSKTLHVKTHMQLLELVSQYVTIIRGER